MGKLIDDVLGSRNARAGQTSNASSGRQGPRPKLQTVAKARFRTLASKGSQPGRGRASGVMRNLDYMTTRPDHEHDHRISRDLITPGGRVNLQAHPEIRQQIFDELAASREKYIYHLVLSSGDRGMSQAETARWATAVLQSKGLTQFYMAVHAGNQGHTEHPHAHVVFCTDTRLDRQDFFDMRRTGYQEQQFYMRLFQELEASVQTKFLDRPAGPSAGTRDFEDEHVAQTKKPDIDIHFG